MKYKVLTIEEKMEQDVQFLTWMVHQYPELKKTSFLFWWFPRDIQVVIERLFQDKLLEFDTSALIGAIMIAGFEFDEDDYAALVIDRMYRSKKTNGISKGAQNLSSLIFGITMTDVSRNSKTNYETKSLLLTTSVP
jgi:hypothetical protein